MKNILLLPFILFLFSCNKSQIIKQEDTREIIKENITSKDQKMKPDYIIYDKVKNLSFDKVISKYKPDKEEDFIFGYGYGNITEFRIELLNIFPEEEIKKGEIKLKEVTWETNDKENLTIWYQKKNNIWLPVYHHIWNKGSEF